MFWGKKEEISHKRIMLSSHPNHIVQAGSMLSGHVEFHYQAGNKGTTLKRVRVELVGLTETSWNSTVTEQRVDQQGRQVSVPVKKTYGDTKYHVNSELLLWKASTTDSAASKSEQTALPEGLVEFPFVFQLPSEAPDSLECGTGHTRYYLRAVFDKPGSKSGNVEIQLALTVVQGPSGSLNDMSGNHIVAKVPLLCCWNCPLFWTGGVHIDLWTDKAEYSVGDVVNIFGTIKNDTNYRLTSLRFRLEKYMVFSGHLVNPGDTQSLLNKPREECSFKETLLERPVVMAELALILPRCTVQLGAPHGASLVKVPIPTTPASRDTEPIQISYRLRLLMDSEQTWISIDRHFTDIRVRSRLAAPMVHPPVITTQPSAPLLHALPDDLPPTYDEAMVTNRGAAVPSSSAPPYGWMNESNPLENRKNM